MQSAEISSATNSLAPLASATISLTRGSRRPAHRFIAFVSGDGVVDALEIQPAYATPPDGMLPHHVHFSSGVMPTVGHLPQKAESLKQWDRVMLR